MEIRNRMLLNSLVTGGISEEPIREYNGLPVYKAKHCDVCVDEVNNEMMYLDGDNIRVISIGDRLYNKMNLMGEGVGEWSKNAFRYECEFGEDD